MIALALALAVGVGACRRSADGTSPDSTPAQRRTPKDRPTVITLTPSDHALPSDVSPAQLQHALVTAAAAWSFPAVDCTSLTLEVSPAGAHRLAAEDGRNVVVFRQGQWCHNDRCGPLTTFPLGAAAMTTIYPEGAAPGAVQEADIELNGASFAWMTAPGLPTAPPPPPASAPRRRAPLTAVLLHEIGHLLGFADTCGSGHGRPRAGAGAAACPPEERHSVMWSGSTRTALTDGDKVRLCAIFPAT